MQRVSHIEQLIMEFRQLLPKESATAQAIDRYEPWEEVARKAITDGYIEFASELGSFVEACVRRST